MEHFLNKKSRQKNVFDVFVNQKFFKIQRLLTIENEHSNKLLILLRKITQRNTNRTVFNSLFVFN